MSDSFSSTIGMGIRGIDPDEYKGTIPRFYMHPQYHAAASEKEGRPIFVEKEYVELIKPGDRLYGWVGEVKTRHKEIWPRYYEAFKKGQTIAHEGTAVEHWPILTVGLVAVLKALQIFTVEQLAEVDENSIRQIGPGGRELRAKALAFLATARDTAITQKQAAELQLRDARISDLEQQIKDIAARIPATEEQRRGPGRPRKDREEAA